jgi:MFS family permease
VETLLILRFLGGAVGSNSLISAGAVVVDQFQPRQRGLALAYYAVTPFLGPTLGPIMGGFVGETLGWRWIEGLLAIFTGSIGIIYIFTVPETYAPVILHRRAKKLTKMTGHVYKTQIEIQQGTKTLRRIMKIALSRPWVMLCREPIVTVLSIYQAIIYATLYLCFGEMNLTSKRSISANGDLQLRFRLCTKKSEDGVLE